VFICLWIETEVSVIIVEYLFVIFITCYDVMLLHRYGYNECRDRNIFRFQKYKIQSVSVIRQSSVFSRDPHGRTNDSDGQAGSWSDRLTGS